MTENDDIRLVRVEGHNIRKLKVVAMRFDGEPGVFRLTGDNEAGKTTAIDCVAMLFGGADAVKPDTIRRGEDGAWIMGELSNGYTVERKFTASAPNGYLTITTPDDMSPKAPQRLLDGWGGPRSFDPGALLKRKVSEIENIILGLAKDTDLKEGLADLATRRKALQEERRPFNSAKQLAERTKKPEGDRPEPVDVSGEMESLKELQAQRQARNGALSAADGVLFDADRKKREADAFASEVASLKARLQEREELEARTRQESERIRKEAHQLNAAACDLPYDEEGIEATEARISQADDINAKLEPWKSWERAKASVKENAKEIARLTGEIKMVDATEEELLKSAEIPVDGISFAEDGSMLLDEHPIEVASGMRRLRMTCDIAFAANPQIKVILLDEANDFGLKALGELDEEAKRRGWQVLACRLGVEGPGEIVIQDGAALSAGEVVEEAENDG